MVFSVDCDVGVVAGSVTVDVWLLLGSVDCDIVELPVSVTVGKGVGVEVASGSVDVADGLVTGLVVIGVAAVTVVD